jgi:hypothetical protein
MLETYSALLTEMSRNLYRNARESPVLYVWFSGMLVFSLMMFAVLTLFMINYQISLKINDIVLSLCFLFLVKSSADFHRYFSTSAVMTYAFSTQVSQKKTLFEIFLVVFWVNLGLFVLLSSLYTVFLGGAGVYLSYPLEYLQVLLGIMLGLVLGPVFALHYFSPHRLRLLPVAGIIAGFWLFQSVPLLLVLLCCAVVYLWWSLRYVLDSYQYVARKKRQQEQLKSHIYESRLAIFHKETITLWRDRLLPSFVFTAALMGGFAGYLTVFGEDLLIPKQLQILSQSFLPTAYGVLGIYVVVIYTAVFPTISMFLNEEHTLWITRHLPICEKTVIQGKVLGLSLPFIASFPFLWFYAAFTGTEYLLFSLWFLVFSFLAAVIVSLPIAAKYVGKKSDILVLYCVALLVFVILGVGFGLEKVFAGSLMSQLVFYVVSILVEVGLLLVSMWLSSILFSLKQKQGAGSLVDG